MILRAQPKKIFVIFIQQWVLTMKFFIYANLIFVLFVIFVAVLRSYDSTSDEVAGKLEQCQKDLAIVLDACLESK